MEWMGVCEYRKDLEALHPLVILQDEMYAHIFINICFGLFYSQTLLDMNIIGLRTWLRSVTDDLNELKLPEIDAVKWTKTC